jgi:hypothetical protein
MNRIPVVLTAFAVFSLASFASAPIATVSSPEPVTLAGHSLSAPGVSSWPVVTGDEITTSTAPAKILFRDGSSVALAAKSSALLTGTSTEPKLVLTAGSLSYSLVAGSKVALSRPTDDNDNGSTGGDPHSIGKAPTATTTAAAHGVSKGVIIAGVLGAAALVTIIPIETLSHSAPASVPTISTH